ncbi:MAG TPA: PH domain-containing protein [Candidatus Microsaccharimonas sp.]|nr:PH domain-containing protein [Candidatus Microsaccharimonas sp.]
MADIRLKQLEEQLKRIGCNYRFWGRSELKELANVLLPGETVEHCVNGSYDGGFALLAATDQRVLLIDKKPLYLTLEDIRFDMIVEIDFNHRLLNANVRICTPNKELRFVAYNHARLRALFHFVQTRVAEIRQHYTMLQQGQQPFQQVAFDTTLSQPAMPAQQFSVPPAVHQMSQLEPSRQELPGPKLHTPKLTHAPHYRHSVPAVSAYTRLPLMSRQRRFLGSRAMNTPQPSMYQ